MSAYIGKEDDLEDLWRVGREPVLAEQSRAVSNKPSVTSEAKSETTGTGAVAAPKALPVLDFDGIVYELSRMENSISTRGSMLNSELKLVRSAKQLAMERDRLSRELEATRAKLEQAQTAASGLKKSVVQLNTKLAETIRVGNEIKKSAQAYQTRLAATQTTLVQTKRDLEAEIAGWKNQLVALQQSQARHHQAWQEERIQYQVQVQETIDTREALRSELERLAKTAKGLEEQIRFRDEELAHLKKQLEARNQRLEQEINERKKFEAAARENTTAVAELELANQALSQAAEDSKRLADAYREAMGLAEQRRQDGQNLQERLAQTEARARAESRLLAAEKKRAESHENELKTQIAELERILENEKNAFEARLVSQKTELENAMQEERNAAHSRCLELEARGSELESRCLELESRCEELKREGDEKTLQNEQLAAEVASLRKSLENAESLARSVGAYPPALPPVVRGREDARYNALAEQSLRLKAEVESLRSLHPLQSLASATEMQIRGVRADLERGELLPEDEPKARRLLETLVEQLRTYTRMIEESKARLDEQQAKIRSFQDQLKQADENVFERVTKENLG